MIYDIILAAILAALATGTIYFLLLKERSPLRSLWRLGVLSWGGALLFMMLLLLAGCAQPARADTLTNCGFNMHVGAWHSEPGFNAMTPGIGVACDLPVKDVRATAGVFRNSISNTSVYAGATWQPLHFGRVDLGFFGGFITGYRDYPLPMAAGLASLHLTPKTLVHLTMLPTVKGLTPATIELSIEHKF